MRVQADLAQVVDGRAQAGRLRDRHRARLELVRRRRERRALHPDGLDHLAAAEERRHLLQQFPAPPEHADAGRAAHLVPGEAEEVGAERGDVHRHVRHRLGGVHQHQRADRVRPVGDRPDRVDRAEHVGLVHERDQLGPLGDQVVDVREVEPAVGRHAEPAQRRPGALAQQLPRHDVGVVLHLGDDDLVAGAEREPAAGPRRARVAHRVGDQVDRLGDVLGEHDLGRLGRADERGHLDPGALVGLRSPPRRAGGWPGGCWRCAARRSRPSRRAPGAASARCWRCPGRPAAGRRGPARSRIGKSLRIRADVEGHDAAPGRALRTVPRSPRPPAPRPAPGRPRRRSGRPRTRARSPAARTAGSGCSA